MEKTRGGKAKFDPDRIVMSGGATGANETMMFCLADPGDAFLVPSPYYPAYEHFLLPKTSIHSVKKEEEEEEAFIRSLQCHTDRYNYIYFLIMYIHTNTKN